MFKYLVKVSLFVCSLVSPLSSVAATWQPVGGTHNGAPLYALYPFEDGVPTLVNWDASSAIYEWGSIDGEWVLTNSSDPSTTSGLFSFGGSFGSAPGANVNWTNQTIDVSGMYFHGVNPLTNTGSGKFNGWIFEQMIGWDVAPSEWYYDPYSDQVSWLETNPFVPFANNGDGTYTASWSYANNVMGGFGDYSLSHMTLTFQAASAVPIPAPVWLFLSGLGTLATFTRARKQQKTAIA